MKKLKTLTNILYMLLGGKLKYPNQSYLVHYSNGSFCTDTGTKVGNISKLVKP